MVVILDNFVTLAMATNGVVVLESVSPCRDLAGVCRSFNTFCELLANYFGTFCFEYFVLCAYTCMERNKTVKYSRMSFNSMKIIIRKRSYKYCLNEEFSNILHFAKRKRQFIGSSTAPRR